jgi:hypothetical protein
VAAQPGSLDGVEIKLNFDAVQIDDALRVFGLGADAGKPRRIWFGEILDGAEGAGALPLLGRGVIVRVRAKPRRHRPDPAAVRAARRAGRAACHHYARPADRDGRQHGPGPQPRADHGHRAGRRPRGVVRARRHRLFHHDRVDAVYVDLPLVSPGTALVADRLEALGVSYSGIFPNHRADGDVLRMQSLHGVRITADDVVVASTTAGSCSTTSSPTSPPQPARNNASTQTGRHSWWCPMVFRTRHAHYDHGREPCTAPSSDRRRHRTRHGERGVRQRRDRGACLPGRLRWSARRGRSPGVSTRVNQYRLRRVLPHPQTGSLIRPTSRGSASPRGRDPPRHSIH